MVEKKAKERSKGGNVMPNRCPSCQEILNVELLFCKGEGCQTKVKGDFQLPVFAKLSKKDQKLVYDFIRLGFLKEMGKEYNLSYPTLRKMMDDVIGKLQKSAK